MATQAVDTTHPEYGDAQRRWNLTRAAVRGLDAVSGKDYIRKRSAETPENYDARVEKAIYTNFTGRTLDGLTGAVFRKNPEILLPPALDMVRASFDSQGLTITQTAKTIFNAVMDSARCGILIDFPETNGRVSLAQMQATGIKPYAALYDANSIINHKYMMVRGKIVLTLLVLLETKSTNNEFSHKTTKQYRVLRLEDGIYTRQMYDDEHKPIEPQKVIKDHNGNTFDHIPFHFIGAENNSPDFDKPPLIDIATLNIGHYRNSADHESNLSIHGCGTLVIATDMSKEEFDTKNPAGLILGENTGILVDKGDTVNLLQLEPASAISEEMGKKEERMQKIGAKIIDKAIVNRTAEAARIDASSETSVLDTVVGNIDEGFTECLRDMGRFAGVDFDPEKFSVKLNRDYWFNKLDPQLAMAMIQLNDVGTLPKASIVNYLKEVDLIDREMTVEDVIELLSQEASI